jgi:hypothetical protein
MADLRSGIGLESAASLFEEFGDHREIALGTRDACVSEVGRQMRQAPLDVDPFAVPRQEPMHGKGVAVMPTSA